jgi:hypothetical protein
MTLSELSELIKEADVTFAMRRTERGLRFAMIKGDHMRRTDSIIDDIEMRQAEILLNEDTLIDVRVEKMAEEMRNIKQST